MNSKLQSSAIFLLLGMSFLPSCSSGSKHTANTGGTGGAPAQGTGGSSSVVNDANGSVTIVAVPNSEDGDPLPKPAGLAPTPPMGWNSWNAYATNVSATLIKNGADLMASNGMKDAGYQYVNIDDGWMLKYRVSSGSGEADSGIFDPSDAGDSVLEPDPVRFPSLADGTNGIQAVADYVHSKGLKLGIYSDRGPTTCGGFAASGGHELTDARTFATWGVDYLKYDNCNAPANVPLQQGYQAMSDALQTEADETSHNIVFSMCSWEFDEWNLQTGQLWRTTGDIAPVFNDRSLLSNTYSDTILQNAALNKIYAAYAGPNNWNDPDMLEVGNGITLTESQTHFNLWAIMAAPLIAGNKLDTMSTDVLNYSDERTSHRGRSGLPRTARRARNLHRHHERVGQAAEQGGHSSRAVAKCRHPNTKRGRESYGHRAKRGQCHGAGPVGAERWRRQQFHPRYLRGRCAVSWVSDGCH